MYRADGYRVRTNSPMYEIAPYIMDKRYDASNSIMEEIDYEILRDYTLKCRERGEAVSHMAVIIAAYLRVASQNPFLNRFVMNKRIYSRNHFCVTFVTLSKTDSTTIKIYFNLDDDVFTVNKKLNDAIESVKEKGESTAMDRIANTLLSIPGLLTAGVSFLKFLDKHFWLPFGICDASPFHTSLFITNLASIRVDAIFHHIYEFGTTSIFCAMGLPKTKVVKDKDGEFREHKVMELGIVTDERIADGHYFGRCFREFSKYLHNPELLEKKPERIVKDTDIKHKNPKFIVR
ncbi:MAG: 2-oxo acid dehydrogenase subunit E2 [Eubacteriaceae bacterium]|nr:2-oxo acid dehydrogenase subunit E2 [Eubacteriaceae bacterium]